MNHSLLLFLYPATSDFGLFSEVLKSDLVFGPVGSVDMQPPPWGGPPGSTGPPPSGPNMFRRTRPQKQGIAATTTMPPPTQPMTDPFAFGRAQPPIAAGGLPTIPNSNPPQMQTPPSTIYSHLGPGLPPQPSSLENIPAAPTCHPPSSVPGVTLFNPHSSASPGVFPAPSFTGCASSNSEQDYFNSKYQTPTTSTELPHIAPTPSETPFNQEFQGQPALHPAPFQLPAPTSSSAQWVPDHGSRPPSVQNYFQPTSDPPLHSLNVTPQTQTYPSHSQSPPTPPAQPGHPHSQACLPPQNPATSNISPWHDPNGPQQQKSQFQSYFNQSSELQDFWFNHSPQDSGYHQMAIGPSHSQPVADSAGYQHVSNTGHGPNIGHRPTSRHGPTSDSASDLCAQESSTLSMFFKDSDVENEETLSDEKNKALNGGSDFFQPHGNPQTDSGHADASLNYQGVSVQDNSHLPYMNESSSQGNPQKPPDTQLDHVENLECVPNQEVLPSEIYNSTAATAPHGVDQFETGPNLETPDSVPRPMRSASVSSNYSNLSHGSGTGTRRQKGVEGTFIQQESPRLADNANPSAATGGYFEQIDTSPAGDAVRQQSSLEQMWHPTPSPPKPTGIFQASANSSFEPVRSHGVGVRPSEVDRAKMVAEGGTDTSGNLEQPPDNMENIYSPGRPPPAATAAGGIPHVTHPLVHSRPSSRAFGANRPCESPATTLWAQNDPTNLGANILLAPAAPTVLAPLREPSADVIQPPEDGPLDLQPLQRIQPTCHQHSENLENPPKVSDSEPTDSQGNLGCTSLLVSGSFHQPVLIAPPVSNYNMIPPSALAQSSTLSSHVETTLPERSLAQGQGASCTQPPFLPSKENPLFSSGPTTFCSSASNQGPLNLTRDKMIEAISEIAAPLQSQPVHPPLSRSQSLSGDNHSTVHVNSLSSLVTASVSNYNQASNFELLDFSMHQSHVHVQASDQPSSLHEMPPSSNGFYLQVTKDAQQGAKGGGNVSAQITASLSTPQVPLANANMQQTQNESSHTSDSQTSQIGQKDAHSVPVSGAQPPPGQSSTSAQGPTAGSAPISVYSPGPQGPARASHPASAEPPRPPSTAGSHQGGYGPPPPEAGQMYGGYYGNYGEYSDNRAPYPPGQYPPPSRDPRAQPYYQVGVNFFYTFLFLLPREYPFDMLW